MIIVISTKIPGCNFQVKCEHEIQDVDCKSVISYKAFQSFTERLPVNSRKALYAVYASFVQDVFFETWEASLYGTIYQFHRKFKDSSHSEPPFDSPTKLSEKWLNEITGSSLAVLKERHVKLRHELARLCLHSNFDSAHALTQGRVLFCYKPRHFLVGENNSNLRKGVKLQKDVKEEVFDASDEIISCKRSTRSKKSSIRRSTRHRS